MHQLLLWDKYIFTIYSFLLNTRKINIPADDEDLVSKFKALDQTQSIVTYCYTEDCMASRQVGKILSEHGMYVQHLNVGYAEWMAKEGTGDVFTNTSGACPLTGSAGC